MITSVDHAVYVIQSAQPFYFISNSWWGRALSSEYDSSSSHIAAIAVKEVDAAFVEIVKFRLRYFQAVDALLEKVGQEAREMSMFQHLKEVQQRIIKAGVSVDSQIKEARSKIARLQRRLDIAEEAEQKGGEELDKDTILQWLRQLSRLRKSLAELEHKQTQALATEEDLQIIAKRLTNAADGWDSLTFEQQKMLVQLIVSKATLLQLTPRWMQLDIAWSSFMGFNFIDRGFIFNLRGRPSKWSDADREKLRQIYPTADCDTILKTFPCRTWTGIMNQTCEMKIKRPTTIPKNTMLPSWMSYEDKEIIETYDINLGEYFGSKPERSFDWKALDSHENDACGCRL